MKEVSAYLDFFHNNVYSAVFSV